MLQSPLLCPETPVAEKEKKQIKNAMLVDMLDDNARRRSVRKGK